tara:strand:+ start:362 stop:862 length:501 start_codon:yes stop_codon:yes gene_type:complete
MFEKMRDIGMTWDGDILFDESGDPKLVTGNEWVVREINKRVRTENPDWLNHPSVGAGVESFVGRPNTQTLGLEIEFAIKKALTVDAFLMPASIEVDTVPTSPTSIAVFITVGIPGQTRLVTQLIFDVARGINRAIPERADSYPLGPVHDTGRHHVTTNQYMLRRGR